MRQAPRGDGVDIVHGPREIAYRPRIRIARGIDVGCRRALVMSSTFAPVYRKRSLLARVAGLDTDDGHRSRRRVVAGTGYHSACRCHALDSQALLDEI